MSEEEISRSTRPSSKHSHLCMPQAMVSIRKALVSIPTLLLLVVGHLARLLPSPVPSPPSLQ